VTSADTPSDPGPEPHPEVEALYEGFDYTEFWKEPGRPNLDVLERWVVRNLLPHHGRRVLDAGCGFGRLASAYEDRFDEVVLMDPAWSLLEAARERVGARATLVAGDVLALPFETGAFDAAVTVRVLHHVDDWTATFAGMRRVMVDGGVWVFNISNKRNLKRIARWAARRGGENPFAEGFERYGDLSVGCHPRDADRLMRIAGFESGPWRGVGIMDKLAARAGAAAPRMPKGRSLSLPLGWVRVAPSEFCAARAGTMREPASVAPEMFRCPICASPVDETPKGHACTGCSRKFAFRDGIHDFRV
jgi:SAM-dependent methyltransferase